MQPSNGESDLIKQLTSLFFNKNTDIKKQFDGYDGGQCDEW